MHSKRALVHCINLAITMGGNDVAAKVRKPQADYCRNFRGFLQYLVHWGVFKGRKELLC